MPKDHADLGPALGLDFETGVKLSGARFTFMRGQMARLNRALGQFMLDHQTKVNGYNECNTPVLVNDAAMYGTDKLPKFADDSFRTTDGRWLIPTAEVSLTSSVAGEILGDAALPMRMTALTLCFRSEAGAAGKDTKGLIRQHQFEKVELVSIVRPEDSAAEHERMAGAAESILQALELPYRKLLLCTGDMGNSARKTYDLEVWLPGQGLYREISELLQLRRLAGAADECALPTCGGQGDCLCAYAERVRTGCGAHTGGGFGKLPAGRWFGDGAGGFARLYGWDQFAERRKNNR